MAGAAARNTKPVQAATILTNTNSITFDYDGLSEAFPDVDPGLKPLGNLGVFMIRRPKMMSAGGIIIDGTGTDNPRAVEYYNTQVAKVIALGPTAFKSVRNVDGEEKIFDWPEGPWFKPGDYVRVPKYGGDRFSVKATVKEFRPDGRGGKNAVEVVDEIIFAVFKVRDIQGVITGNPLSIKAYLD
jgi:hypothetical protein